MCFEHVCLIEKKKKCGLEIKTGGFLQPSTRVSKLYFCFEYS